MRVDFGRAPDARIAATGLFGTWRVGTADRQRAVVASVEEAWQARSWPGPGLDAYGVLIGDDDDTLLHVSLAEYPDAVGRQDLSWKRDVDTAVLNIDRVGVAACRRHRSTPAFCLLDRSLSGLFGHSAVTVLSNEAVSDPGGRWRSSWS
ncbi:hypothetical protein GCM10022254_42020 [Actinomadura meridiana]|uniref:Uncharacterized protein n=1 Tax=Actinomadura meridiana TaxID=559626 RepID=A0ABP8C7S4_9ACTN